MRWDEDEMDEDKMEEHEEGYGSSRASSVGCNVKKDLHKEGEREGEQKQDTCKSSGETRRALQVRVSKCKIQCYKPVAWKLGHIQWARAGSACEKVKNGVERKKKRREERFVGGIYSLEEINVKDHGNREL